MNTLITGTHLIEASVAGAPTEIVFIPEGSHKITPQSHPKGVTISLPPERGEEIAAKLNATLQRRLGENVKPWFDFEHSRKFPASGYPTSFRYQPGKGIMAVVDWSGSGKRAIDSRDVRYFSPEFLIDEAGVPHDLPQRGPLGGLVTEPAFRQIQPLAASEAQPAEDESEIDVVARQIVEAGEAPNLDEAFAIAASRHPGLYENYLASLSSPACRVAAAYDDPAAELDRRARELVSSGGAADMDEAWTRAAAADDELYRAYSNCLSG